MAALDFPNSPTLNQQYAAPNGVTYQWDGAAWVVTGGPPGQLWTGGTGTLTPTDTTKRVVIPGPTTAVDQSQLVLSTRTQKGRLGALPGLDWYGAMLNAWYDGSAWHADDTTKACWSWDFYNDQFVVGRAAGTSPGTITGLLVLDNAGNLTVPVLLVSGGGTTKGMLQWSADQLYLSLNNTWVPQDTTKASWLLSLRNDTQSASIAYRAPNTAAGTNSQYLTFDISGNFLITGPTATKASGTTWANPSDRRLKDNIADYTTGLAAILGLSPRTFFYNGKGGSTAGMRGEGFIADEVEPVMPEMVGTMRAKLNPDDAEETDIAVLDTSTLVLALVNAVKELAARIATLEGTATPAHA